MLQKLKKYAMIYLYCQVFGEYIRKEMTFGTNNHHRCASLCETQDCRQAE